MKLDRHAPELIRCMVRPEVDVRYLVIAITVACMHIDPHPGRSLVIG